MSSKDEPVLPADLQKEVVKKHGYPEVVPKKGDEVRVMYVGRNAADGYRFDASPDGKPFSFKLGIGEVMEGWDRAVATMKKGEVAKFTIPEMYLSGGSQKLLEKIPEDTTVIYEIELVGVTSITDLFGDGGVIQTIETQEDMYGKSPKVGDEVRLTYEVFVGSESINKRSPLDYKVGHGNVAGLIPGKVLDKVLLGIKRTWSVALRCQSDYFGEAVPDAATAGAFIIVKIMLDQIFEVEDVSKKMCWSEGLVVKKAIKVIAGRLVPGMDGTQCTAKLLSARRGDEVLVAEEETFTFVPGNGELCDALEAGCARMRKGEEAIITARSLAADGAGGGLSTSLVAPGKPAGVAAAATIAVTDPVIFHVIMEDFERPPPEDGPSGEEARLRYCTEQKDRGSGHFKQGRFRLAQERYSRILELLPRYKRDGSSSIHVEMFEHEDDRRRAQELRISCKLNLAACGLKLEEFYAAGRHCDAVLKDEPQNVKAIYRRAQAYVGTKDFDAAAQDCRRILELESGHREAQQLLHKAAQLKKEEAKKQRAQFAGKF